VSARPKSKKRYPPGKAEDLLDRLEHNSAKPKDFEQRIPKPLVVEVLVKGKPVHALIDSGSLADFMSTKLADQLKVKHERLAKPIPIQLAVTGSRSMVNWSTTVEFEYQDIRTH
jgi:hypothetical protein